jgi:hypothetical protein
MRALVERGHVGPVHEAARADPDRDQYAITPAGWAFLEALGVVVPSSRQPVRHHRDSIEEGSHLSGALGRALLTRFVDLGWLQRDQNRGIHISPEGREGFDQQFGTSLAGDLPERGST